MALVLWVNSITPLALQGVNYTTPSGIQEICSVTLLVLQKRSYIPAREHQSRGYPTPTFVEVLAQDAGVESSAQLARRMDEREDWKVLWRTRLRTT